MLLVRVQRRVAVVEQRHGAPVTVTPPTRYSAASAFTFGSSASFIQA